MSRQSLSADKLEADTWSRTRLLLARLAAAASVLAYSWWVVTPLLPGVSVNINGFLSDLEASGQRDAVEFQHLDLLSGILLTLALLLLDRRRIERTTVEWAALLTTGIAGAAGGVWSEACVEGIGATCRRKQWSFELPIHHYLHMAAGVIEFAAATVAIYQAYRRTARQSSPAHRIYRALWWVLVVSYPLLFVSYEFNKLGALIEPIFFTAFGVFELAIVLERPHISDVGAALTGSGN